MGEKLSQASLSSCFHGKWVILLFGTWVIGLGHSVALTRLATATPDRYQDIALYEPVRDLVGNALYAGFQTDFGSTKKTHSRYWRAQFAATPIVLRITESNQESLRAIRENLKARGYDFLLYEFKKMENFRQLEVDLREFAAAGQCELITHPIAKKIVLFEIRDCKSD